MFSYVGILVLRRGGGVVLGTRHAKHQRGGKDESFI